MTIANLFFIYNFTDLKIFEQEGQRGEGEQKFHKGGEFRWNLKNKMEMHTFYIRNNVAFIQH